jgi:hypothetical protein
MKPYVLNYSETMSLNKNRPQEGCHRTKIDSTLKTDTLEPSDPDEILLDSTCSSRLLQHKSLYLSTQLSESIESIDPDEIVLDSTIITRSIEPSDDESIGLN